MRKKNSNSSVPSGMHSLAQRRYKNGRLVALTSRMLDTIRITAAKIVPQTERARYAPGLFCMARFGSSKWYAFPCTTQPAGTLSKNGAAACKNCSARTDASSTAAASTFFDGVPAGCVFKEAL